MAEHAREEVVDANRWSDAPATAVTFDGAGVTLLDGSEVTWLRNRSGVAVLDEFGNLRSAHEATSGGGRRDVESTYENRSAPWLIGLPRTIQSGALGDEIAHGRRGPPDDPLDVVGEAIVPIAGVEAGHGREVLEEVIGQAPTPQLLIAPGFERDVDIVDGAMKRISVLCRHGLHVQREHRAAARPEFRSRSERAPLASGAIAAAVDAFAFL
ncbi:hypothetical protein [Sorangium sp. So ce887]|uniref:hypothetical protein n=1 Tax=Sorangium sp. So ce887 TaxID=3133324 RepID=UPI003F64580A